jgi:hypothetical protein
MADQIIKSVPFSHKSARAKELFRKGIEVQKILQSKRILSANLSKDINLEIPQHSEITHLSKTYEIPYLLARQLVLHPRLDPFYLLIPAEYVKWHIKKSLADEDGWIRIPCLGIDEPWVFWSNVSSVGCARVSAQTVHVDLIVGPDLGVSDDIPKNGRCISAMKDPTSRWKAQINASHRDEWRRSNPRCRLKPALKRPAVRITS